MLMQGGKELQGCWIVGFEASNELVGQARLVLDELILVTCQQLEFLDDGTIRM